MRTMLAITVVLALGVSLWLTSPSDAQSVVLVDGGAAQAPEGGFVFSSGSSAFGLVFELREDSGWSAARDKLLARARDGKHVSVIHALEQVRARSEEKVQARIDSVLEALTEESLYPLSSELVAEAAQALAQRATQLAAAKGSGDHVAAVLMAIERAERAVDEAISIRETGKLPKAKGRARIGRVIGAGG